MTIRACSARGAAFEMAKQMYERSIQSMTAAEMFSAQDFGKDASNQKMALARGITNGWLDEHPGGLLKLSIGAKIYFDGKEAPSKPVQTGSVATPRTPLISVFERPALSRKHIPNRLGPRDDVPAFSVRERVSFCTVG